MKKNCLAGLATVLFFFSLVCIANATSLSILNSGFENPALSDGAYGPPVNSWVLGSDTTIGTWNPQLGVFFNTEVPEGNNVAYMNSSWMYQDLTSTYQANTNYTLTFQTGWRTDQSQSVFDVFLRRADTNTNLATLTSANILQTQGLWTLNTLTLMSGSIDPSSIGENIRIVFSKLGGGQVDIDDVQLTAVTADPSPIPEPATMFLLGTGLVGVAGAARRKKKNQA